MYRAPALSAYFNSRPSARGDENGYVDMARIIDFNSRPSARGDISYTPLVPAIEHFNSRPSARGDSPLLKALSTDNEHFNSRPSARGDTSGGADVTGWGYFNSRPSARGDLHPQRAERVRCISIHAPPRGATARRRRKSQKWTYFNSRPSARGDGKTAEEVAEMDLFQFTPLREGRQHGSKRHQ